jgi:Flp pilus assembly protein TadD
MMAAQPPRAPRSVTAVVLTCLLGAAVIAVEVREWRQELAWDDSVRLPRHVAAGAQRSAFRTAHTYVTIGDNLLRKGAIQGATDNYRLALEAQKDFVTAHQHLALAYAVAGDANRAIEEYQRVLELKRDEPTAHFNLGVLLAERGDREQAAAHFRRVLDLNPSDTAARQELCKLTKNCPPETPQGR